jgi:FAD/FMN-containing dehydrogenase
VRPAAKESRGFRVLLTPLVVPYSGGSSVEGHFSAPFGGVSIDFSSMNQILELHSEEYAELLHYLATHLN